MSSEHWALTKTPQYRKIYKKRRQGSYTQCDERALSSKFFTSWHTNNSQRNVCSSKCLYSLDDGLFSAYLIWLGLLCSLNLSVCVLAAMLGVAFIHLAFTFPTLFFSVGTSTPIFSSFNVDLFGIFFTLLKWKDGPIHRASLGHTVVDDCSFIFVWLLATFGPYHQIPLCFWLSLLFRLSIVLCLVSWPNIRKFMARVRKRNRILANKTHASWVI